MGEALLYLPRPGSRDTVVVLPHPSGSKPFAPSHRRFQEEATWLWDWPPRSPVAIQPRKGFSVPLSLSLHLPWPSSLVELPPVGVLKQCWQPPQRLTPTPYKKHKHPQSSGGAHEELKTLLFRDEALLVG